MLGIDGVLVGGAGATILGALGWAVSLLFKAAQTRSDAGAATVTDAAAANAALVSSLTALQEENARLRSRVSSLEDELDERDKRIDALEVKARDMEQRFLEQLRVMSDELAALKRR